MSAHFSKFLLNTYCGTPYFRAHVPEGYPTSRVLQKCRAFRRLPPNLRHLSALAKQWAERNHAVDEDMRNWYDAAGNELDPSSGKPLTDEEIDAQWRPDPGLSELKVEDIPVPEGGFPDPGTWRPKEVTDADEDTSDGPTEAQILSDIAGHGRTRTAQEYGVPEEDLAGFETDEELAQFILEKRG